MLEVVQIIQTRSLDSASQLMETKLEQDIGKLMKTNRKEIQLPAIHPRSMTSAQKRQRRQQLLLR